MISKFINTATLAVSIMIQPNFKKQDLKFYYIIMSLQMHMFIQQNRTTTGLNSMYTTTLTVFIFLFMLVLLWLGKTDLLLLLLSLLTGEHQLFVGGLMLGQPPFGLADPTTC